MEQQEHVFRWEAPEYPFHKKSVDWYWWFALVTIGLVVLSLYLNNILFVFVIIIGAFSALLYTVKPPRIFECTATTRGIKIEKKLYPYQSIDYFWIKDPEDIKSEKVLILQSKKALMPLVIIPLGNANIDELRHFLLDFMEEQEIDEPLGQKIMEWLGF